MTIGFLEKRIEELAEANGESWAACGNVADMGYFEGFAAACEEILKIVREEEEELG